MYKIFDTLADYNQYTDNGTRLTAGILYLVKENKSLYFQTNNIDGETEKYEYLDEIPEGYIKPEGNIIITENGEEIDISTYATASVNVPIPEGYIIPTGNKEITQNGTNIDVNDYATASVNVTPNLTTQNITQNGTYQPSGNYDGFSSVTVAVPQPTGNISITENGENIDIAQYATATVNVAGSGGNEDLIDLIERNITSINIPNGTTKIGDYVFSDCTGLTSITIPNSVTSIGQNAFDSCTGLTSITIPNSVTSIGERAFDGCDSLPVENYIRYADTVAFELTDNTQTAYTLKTGTRFIYDSLFNGCDSLTNIIIPDSVISIGKYAFDSCTGLTSVTIPDSVTSIGDDAFLDCKGLTSVTIGSGVTSIGDEAFCECSGLRSITIPDSVTSIGNTVFSRCLGLTSVTIGSGVTSIGSSAFYNCSDLTSVTINATTPPTLVNANAFKNTNDCPIYVPAASVNAYKAATNWSTYADRIQAIA